MSGRSLASEIQKEYILFLTANYNYVGASALLIYEHLLTLSDEITYVWPLQKGRLVKWIFLFMRYFALFSLTAFQYASTYWPALYDSSGSTFCRLQFVYRIVSTQLMMTAVQLVLSARVRALYGNRVVSALLYSLMVAQIIVLGVLAGIMMPLKSDTMQTCNPILHIQWIGVYTSLLFSLQISMLALAVYKYYNSPRRRMSIVTTILGDGALAFTTLSAMELAIIICLLRGEFNMLFIQCWEIALLSCVGCRLIIHLQRMAKYAPSHDLEIEFTTRFSNLSSNQPSSNNAAQSLNTFVSHSL